MATMNAQLRVNFLAHFTDGVMLSLFGPLIPFLADETHQSESDFNFIFAMRGIAYILAAFLQKSLLQHVSPTLRMLSFLITCSVCFLVFSFTYQYSLLLGLVSLLLNLGIGSVSILANVCLLQYATTDAKYYISLSYGVYGIGGMTGPILVSLFGLHSLYLLAAWTFAIGVLYIFFLREEHKLQAHETPPAQLPKIDDASEKALCLLFLLYSSITLTFRSWLPSFAVMERITTKENAALALSLYSVCLTVCRFVFLLLDPEEVRTLRSTSVVLFLTLGGGLISYLTTPIFIVFGNSIILGILFSNYCPYLYALPARFHCSLDAQATSNTIIAYAFGEAIVSTLVGYLMSEVHPLMLFVTLLAFALLNILTLEYTVQSLDKKDHSVFSELIPKPERV